MGWISPTGFVDSDSRWTLETRAYDDSIGTDARSDDLTSEWSSFLELTHASMLCDKVKFIAYGNPLWSPTIDIDVYYGGAWHDVYQGAWTNNVWIEKGILSAQYITAFRFRINNTQSEYGGYASIWEVKFNEYAPPETDIGRPAIVRPFAYPGNWTRIVKGNPASYSGKITQVCIHAYQAMTGVEVGTFFQVSGNYLSTRDTKYIGNVPIGYSEHEVDLTVQVGDFLGIHYASGAIYCSDTDYGEDGYWRLNSDAIPCTSILFIFLDNVTMSLCGTGTAEALTLTVQAPTDIMPTTVTANGNIITDGYDTVVTRGFKYGLTQADTWDSHEDGAYGVGAYTRPLTNLLPNTLYWIRAYATNSTETSYSTWTSFQTSASGTIPTGTLINICSDYSAFTYKLQRSESDDGEFYVGYFVINTDLAEKQGLDIYKRILDLHLYFRCEAFGTAEIHVKRDSEKDWQYLGSVSLADVTEPTIIVKHLAVDVRAKDYDFKVSFGNACRFLGVVYEFIPEGDR